MKLLIFCSLILATFQASAFTADLYEKGSNHRKKLFTQKHEIATENGLTKTYGEFRDLAGNLALEENATLQGDNLVRFEIDQKQLNQKGIVEVKDGKVWFTKMANGKEDKSSEKLGKTLVISANFQNFVKSQWAQIMKGETVEFRYAVWDRQETVGFEISKTGEEVVAGKKAVVLKMKASSFIIARIVDPIQFKFTEDGSQYIELNGRVAPKIKKGEDWKDLDAEVVYNYN